MCCRSSCWRCRCACSTRRGFFSPASSARGRRPSRNTRPSRSAVDVLIVDDHPLIHETLAVMVQRAIPGATVHAETELGAAIARAMGLPNLRLALLDLGLPGYSGIQG